MPIFSYFAVVGSVLVALLFAADASLPQRGPLAVSSNFQGLPKAWHPDQAVNSLAAIPAPAPDMTSAAVQAAASPATHIAPAPHIANVPAPVVAAASPAETAPEQTAKIEPAPKKKKVAARKPRRDEDRQNYAWSRNSDNGSLGGGGSFFGRF